MLELLAATTALIVVLALSWHSGRRKTREALARALSRPDEVRRLYLRSVSDTDGFWLHVEMQTGKKRVLAAPWDLQATLRRLETVGLRLSDADQAALEATRTPDVSASAPVLDHAATGESQRHAWAPSRDSGRSAPGA